MDNLRENGLIAMDNPLNLLLPGILRSLLSSQRRPYKQLLKTIEKATAPTLCVLNGMSGTGKTMIVAGLAYEYTIRQHRKNFYKGLPSYTNLESFLWVNGTQADTILASLCFISNEFAGIGAFELPLDLKENEIVSRLIDYLNTSTNWVLIVDNLQDREAFLKYFGDLKQGKIIVTTDMWINDSTDESSFKLPNFLYSEIKVKCPGIEHSLGFLAYQQRKAEAKLFKPDTALKFNIGARPNYSQEYARRPDLSCESGVKLAEILGCCPSELQQAALYMARNQVSSLEYLGLYKKRLAELVAAGNDYPNFAATSLTWRKIQETDKATADLLKLLAFCGNGAMPYDFLRHTGRHLLPGTIDQAIKENTNWLAFQNLGFYYDLIKYNPDTESLFLKPEARAVIVFETSDEETREGYLVVSNIFSAFVDENPPTNNYHWRSYTALRSAIEENPAFWDFHYLLDNPKLQKSVINVIGKFAIFQEIQGNCQEALFALDIATYYTYLSLEEFLQFADNGKQYKVLQLNTLQYCQSQFDKYRAAGQIDTAQRFANYIKAHTQYQTFLLRRNKEAHTTIAELN
jgi:hypothetical protein